MGYFRTIPGKRLNYTLTGQGTSYFDGLRLMTRSLTTTIYEESIAYRPIRLFMP